MMRFTCLTVFMLLLVSTSAQNENPEPPTERVLSIHDDYPIYETHRPNVTKQSNIACQCEEGYDVTESQWNSWSLCTGSKGNFECHKGIRYRSRPCQSNTGSSDICSNREWRYCYHQESCTGQWVEWLNPNAACSRSCGGGIMYKIRICQRGKEIGLFCESDQRTPYNIRTIPCNTRQCTVEDQEYTAATGMGVRTMVSDQISQTTTASDLGILVDDSAMGSAEKLKKNQEKTSPQPVNAQLVPNVTTWIAAGIGGVAVLVMVIITICVSRRKKRELQKSNDYTELDIGGNNSALMVRKSSNHSFTNSQAIGISSTRPSDSAVAVLHRQHTPPVLHHSLNSSKFVLSESETYSFPSTPEQKRTDHLFQQLEAAGYMGSTANISKADKSSQDCIQRVSLPADNYLESSSTSIFQTKNKKSFDGTQIKGTTKTAESTKTTTFRKLPGNDEFQIERPESHIYAEITPRIGLAV